MAPYRTLLCWIKGPSGPHRFHQGAGAQYRHHPLQVVSQYVQTHLSADPIQGLRQKVRRAHPGLDRPKRMRNGLPTDAHGVRGLIQAGLHRVENGFMFPACHPSLWAWCAVRFERALLTVRTPVLVQIQPVLGGSETPDQALPCGTTVLVLLRVVNEIGLVESPVGLGAGGDRLGNDRGNAGLMARQNFFALEIAPVRDGSQFLSVAMAVRACSAMPDNWSRSMPTFVTSCATIK
jgi:hypothetical protein